MEEKDILKSRIKELSMRANNDSYMTCTSFLSMSEQSLFFSILKEEGIDYHAKKYYGVSYFLYGGIEESDRKILCFLPYYMKEEEAKEKLDEGEFFSCLYVTPKNEKFADCLTHRDYLGALMHLGIKREMIGDILTDSLNAYIFLSNNIVDVVKAELIKIKHTSVVSTIKKPRECLFAMRFEEVKINVSSLRLDCILAEVYPMSRRDSQVLIASENVFVNGMTCKSNSYMLKENDRVSIKGKGKFIFLCSLNRTKKDRLFVKIKKYS